MKSTGKTIDVKDYERYTVKDYHVIAELLQSINEIFISCCRVVNCDMEQLDNTSFANASCSMDECFEIKYKVVSAGMKRFILKDNYYYLHKDEFNDGITLQTSYLEGIAFAWKVLVQGAQLETKSAELLVTALHEKIIALYNAYDLYIK